VLDGCQWKVADESRQIQQPFDILPLIFVE
jgi:hypothetical protein